MPHILSDRFRRSSGNELLAALSTAGRAGADRLLHKISTGEYQLVEEACPCGTDKPSVKLAEIDRNGLPLDFMLCRVCGTVRIDPYLNAASLADFYTHIYQHMYGRATDLADYFRRQRVKLGRLVATYQSLLHKSATILEIGCGAGGGVSLFQELGFQAAGCDYDAELIEFGRSRGVANLTLGSVAEVIRTAPGAQFDFIYLHHVFEHVRDPIGMLGELKSLLSDTGRTVIIVPDISRIAERPWPADDVMPFLHLAHKYNYTVIGLERMGRQNQLFSREIKPANYYPISRCPEIWIEYSLVAHQYPVTARRRQLNGVELQHYLQQAETRFLDANAAQRRAAG